MTADVLETAERRADYDYRISRARVATEHAVEHARAAAEGYTRARVDGCAPEVLDDARLVKVTAAIAAASAAAALDYLLDTAALEVGRPREAL